MVMKIQDKITAAKRAEDNAQLMGIVKNDSYLVPFNEAICGRHNHAVERIKELTFEGKQTLSDFANGYNYYGLHKTMVNGYSVNGFPMLQICI